jgi:uncharacterized membrane protein
MSMTPVIAVHATAAIAAVAIGPVALWARRGRQQRPRLHRAFGYAWVTLMLITAISALFIHGGRLPNIAGFSPIHLLVPLTLFGLYGAFRYLAQGNIKAHKKIMTGLYFGAGVGAGVFTLLPDRLLGRMIWIEWLGLLPAQPASASQARARSLGMLAQIFANTPLWVWGLLAGLIVLGLSQTRTRTAGLPRIVILPVAMGAFSLWGTLSAFGIAPVVVIAWTLAAALLVALVLRKPVPAGTRFDAATRQFHLPGSWVPMFLILGIFLTKYAVGVTLAMRPDLRALPDFTLAVAIVSGAFSGLFAGRTVRLLRLAARPATLSLPVTA